MAGSRPRPPPRRAAAPAAALLAAALFAGCGGLPPKIEALDWRLELRPSKVGAYETLSAFASISDEDGDDDVVQLWVVNDDSALAWSLTNADWVRRAEGEASWIGGSGLARHDYGPLPRGDWRVVAVDAAGETVERSFKVEGDFPSLAAPQLSFSGGKLKAVSAWPETLILGYDGAGGVAAMASSLGAAESPEELFGAEAAKIVEAAAYGFDPNRKMGAYSWKTKLR